MSEFISPDDLRYGDRARALVRIGRDAIAIADDAALDAYFSKDFAFHGPDGDFTFPELRSFFAAMRSAFTDFSCERSEIIVQGDLAAARTTMSGVFEHEFLASPVGAIQPNGATMTLNLINLFRYDSEGRLAEEWAQYDNMGFLRQLGVEMKASTPGD